jgi:hypothetical protein
MDIEYIITPPERPSYAGRPDDWPLVEQVLEIELPPDFKKLLNSYGIGAFFGFLFPFSPFAPFMTDLNLLSGGTRQILSAYEKGRREYPEYTPPFNAHPSKPGLFPWARTINGDVLFWLTRGEPIRWPVVVCDSKFSEDYDLYEMDTTSFLCQWIGKKISPKAFPGNSVSREPPFAPYRASVVSHK